MHRKPEVYAEFELKLRRETEKAYCFDDGTVDDDGIAKHVWVAKSKAKHLGGDRYSLPTWIARQEGLDCFAVSA